MRNENVNTDEEIRLAWEILDNIYDPEIPVVSIVDLGIVREINVITENQHISVSISPTYSGCPAMDVISMNIRQRLLSHGYNTVEVKNVLSPAWTTEWISAKGKEKMRKFGIASPEFGKGGIEFFGPSPAVHCPLCNSAHTHLVSEFGSTACKALYKCNDCLEPFDVFKCH